MKFAGDGTVGGLVRWLRALGYDTWFYNGPADDTFFGLSRQQGRILLSRNTKFLGKTTPVPVIVLRENAPKDQLKEVVKRLNLRPRSGRLLSRCLRCNGRVRPVDRKTVQGLVPDYVWVIQCHFSRCDLCGRLYWPGTHVARFCHEIESLFGDREKTG